MILFSDKKLHEMDKDIRFLRADEIEKTKSVHPGIT